MEKKPPPLLLSQRVTMQTHLGHRTQLELVYGGHALSCLRLLLSGHGTYQQNFQRFPHSLHTTKVVMGSSELRVCTWV